MDADLLNETSEGQREEGAAGGSRELPEHSIDLRPVEGEKEGRGLGMKAVVCCAVPEQRFPVNRVWSGSSSRLCLVIGWEERVRSETQA